MLIGGDFNSKAKELLIVIAELSDNDTEIKVAVEELADSLSMDKTELKNLLEYLDGKDLIHIATIGGPFLYGHIQITKKGILKALNK